MNSCNPSDINQTFIIEPQSLTGGTPVVSACTAVYTNEVISCSGDTQISLGSGYVTINNNLLVNNSISGDSFYSNNYYSGGTNLLDIFRDNDKYITGGTFNNLNETLTISRNDGVDLTITGFTDLYTTGATLVGDVLYFNRNDALSAYTVDLSSIVLTDTYVTGGTFDSITRILTLTRNNDVSLTVSGFSDTFTTGATYNDGFVYFNRNDALSAYTLDLRPLTGDSNTYVTGGTLSGNTLILERNDGAFVGVDMTDIRFSGGTGHCISDFYVTNIHGCSPITIHDSLILLSGLTINLPIEDNTQSQIIVRDLGTGEIKYRDVQSIISAATSQDTYTTGLTYSNNILTLKRNDGVDLIATIDSFSGLTVNGDLVVTGNSNFNSISATTYYNLPTNTDVYVSGGTYDSLSGITTFTNTTGGTFDINGYFKPSDDIFTTGLTFNIGNYDLVLGKNDGVNYTVNLGILSSDVTITGGTYNINTGVVTFTNNTGGTFSVSGFSSGMTDTTVTSFSYDNANKLTIVDSTGGTFNSVINLFTGLTINGNLTVTGDSISKTISATTYYNLPVNFDVFVTGGTYSNGTANFINNTGGTFSVTGFVTGDTYLTGGTFNNVTDTLSLVNNTGGTFQVTGFTDLYTTGATLVGDVLYFNRNDALSAYTVSLTSLAVWVAGSAGISSIRANNSSSTDATGNYAVAEGFNTKAIGNNSHAEGQSTTASGTASHVEGKNSTAAGGCSHAEGDGNVASGFTAHAEGSGTQALGQSAHAEGSSTTASGNVSHAEGYSTTATGLYSHAQGWTTLASGQGSHAQGYETIASGDYSFAGGANELFSSGLIKSVGLTSFNFSYSNIDEPLSGAVGNHSAILGGGNHNILSAATASGIFVGSGNTVNTNVVNSAIIGGYGISATVSNMVYVPSLTIVTGLTNDNNLTQVLVRANDGVIKYRTVQSIVDTVSGATSGATITAFTYNDSNTFVLVRNDGVSYSANFSTITGLTTSGDIIPVTDSTVDLGTTIKRFRNINTVSGTSTVWTSTTSVTTAALQLGLDSSGNTRTITADNSIIQNDTLLGGVY
jgi:hypothetical protein